MVTNVDQAPEGWQEEEVVHWTAYPTTLTVAGWVTVADTVILPAVIPLKLGVSGATGLGRGRFSTLRIFES